MDLNAHGADGQMTEHGSDHLQISEQPDTGGQYLITVGGEIDLSTAPRLAAAITRAVDSGALSVGFDLSGVEFLDSSGLAVLLEAAGAVPQIRLVDPSPTVRRVIEISGLTTILPVVP